MNLPIIHHEANNLIAATYGTTNIPKTGYVTVSVEGKYYKVSFQQKETGWIITKTEVL